jgi:SAM-dependent methyltransferase
MEQQQPLDDVRARLGAVDPFPSLAAARYAECVECFEARSDQRRQMIAFVADQVVPTLPGDRAGVLSIGCGSGAFDAPVLDAVAGRSAAVRYVGIDPNPVQCAAFAERLGGAPREGITVEVRAGAFEATPIDEAFDLVHLTHCLYYLEAPGRAVGTALELVAPGGALLVFLAPNEALNALADACWARERQGRRAWFADDLDAFLRDELRLPFERHRIDASLDAGPCFEPDSPEGDRLLDFIVQAETTRFPATLSGAMRRYLAHIASRDAEGRPRQLPHPVDAFLIRRPRSR